MRQRLEKAKDPLPALAKRLLSLCEMLLSFECRCCNRLLEDAVGGGGGGYIPSTTQQNQSVVGTAILVSGFCSGRMSTLTVKNNGEQSSAVKS